MPLPFNSSLTLYHDIPFDPMYEHSVLFSTVQAQQQYFASMVVADNVKFRNLSYQRYQRGSIKVQSKMSLLTNCNYLKFYNNGVGAQNEYEDVDFYCFITGIEYINENTVQINYEIDHFQTWMFYYRMNPCYVEREHVASDGVGEHRIPEGLDTGEYVMAGWEPISAWESSNASNSAYVVVATQQPDGTKYPSFWVDNTYSTLQIAFAAGTAGLAAIIQAYLNGATQSTEPIISISQFPIQFLNNDTSGTIAIAYTLLYDQSIGLGGFKNWNPTTETYLTYLPQNNKLFAYPYNYMLLESPEGSSTILKYEDFKTFNTHQFQLGISVFPMVQMICNPIAYQSGDSVNVRESLCSNMFPVVGVASPSFEAWWAQNKWFHPLVAGYVDAYGAAVTSAQQGDNSTFLNALKNSVSSIITGLAAGGETTRNPAIMFQNAGVALSDIGNVLTAKDFKSFDRAVKDTVVSTVKEIGSDLAAIESHKAVPDIAATKASGNSVIHKTQLDCFKVYYTQIRPENAKIIDDYLSAFGYAVHSFKVPERTSRYYWNYVKTKGCTIMPISLNGNYLPNEAEHAVCAIYDKGITIWHDPSQIKIYWHEDPYGNVVMYNPIVSNGRTLTAASFRNFGTEGNNEQK